MSGTTLNASFDAFGRRRGAAWTGTPSSGDWSAIASTTRRGYTEHSMLDNLELIHMNGRVQDPVLGRFLSADPYIPDPLSTQSYNRYSYVQNNPLSFTDPSGFCDTNKCPPISKCDTIALLCFPLWVGRGECTGGACLMYAMAAGAIGNEEAAAATARAAEKYGMIISQWLAPETTSHFTEHRDVSRTWKDDVTGVVIGTHNTINGVQSLMLGVPASPIEVSPQASRGAALLEVGTMILPFSKGRYLQGTLLAAPKMVKHHIFNVFRGNSPASQVYRDFFKKHGIELDKHTVEVSEAVHRQLHAAGDNWTTKWKSWIDANPHASTKEVYQQAGRMMDDYGIGHLPIGPY